RQAHGAEERGVAAEVIELGAVAVRQRRHLVELGAGRGCAGQKAEREDGREGERDGAGRVEGHGGPPGRGGSAGTPRASGSQYTRSRGICSKIVRPGRPWAREPGRPARGKLAGRALETLWRRDPGCGILRASPPFDVEPAIAQEIPACPRVHRSFVSQS